MVKIRRRAVHWIMGGLTITVVLSVIIIALHTRGDASAQEPTPEPKPAVQEPAATPTGDVQPDPTPADSATPTAVPGGSCTNERLSVDKVRNSKAARQDSTLSSASFSDLPNGAIKVEVAGRVLVIQGGGELVGLLVPPDTPAAVVTALHILIDEVAYAC